MLVNQDNIAIFNPMATAVKLIDLNRSYIPIDPNSFPESMHSTQQEDAPEGRIPVVPYDGYNFMPTSYGYMSYFGIGSILGVNALTKLTSPFALLRVDDLFIIQTTDLRNIMVALCEDGIYTKYAASTGAWDKVITLTEPASGLHKNYTKCVIGNEVYIYRAGEANVWVCRDAEDFVPTALSPSTNINTAAQQGIFKAGGRLGMWDSANSIAWSDVDDKMDFVPDLETGAGATIFQQIVGKIVNCMQHGNGFIVYSTRSIVHARRTADANYLWSSEAIFNDNGISYLNEATQGQPDTTHFAYTTFGIVIIKNGQYEYIIPEVFTYLKERREPVYLRLLEGRYLFFQFLNSDYVLGSPNFSHEGVPGSSYTFKGASYNIDHVTENACKAISSIDNSVEGAFLYGTYGYTAKTQAVAPAGVPIWQDNLSLNFPLADMKVFKASGAGGVGSPDYFDSTGFTLGGIPKADGSGDEFFIPTKGPGLVSSYPTPGETIHQETNTRDFYAKQDFIWWYERWMFGYWKDAISRKAHANSTVTTGTRFTPSAAVSNGVVGAVIKTEYTFGPYIDLSFFSEANKYYGLSASRKTAWLQRSLTKGIKVQITDLQQATTGITAGVESYWVFDPATYAHAGGAPNVPTTSLVFSSYETGAGALRNSLAAIVAAVVAANPGISGLVTGSRFYEAPGTMLSFPNEITDNDARYVYVGIDIEADIDAITFTYRPGIVAASVGLLDYAASELGSGYMLNTKVLQVIGGTSYVSAYPSVPASGLLINDPVYISAGETEQSFARPVFKSVDYPTCTYKNLGFTKITGHGHYDLLGAFVVDDAIPEAADYTDICNAGPKKNKQPQLQGVAVADGIGVGCLDQEATIDTEEFVYPDETITLPPSSFLMQDGSIEPIYPTFQGAFVYDLQYKKWGKLGQPHNLLLNYSPINSQAGDAPIPADIFNVNAGCLLEDGTIALFDKFPENSRIVIGKIGYYRKGFTDCEEVRIQFRSPATGNITVEGSFDGKNIEPAISQTKSYTNVNEFVGFFSNSARWLNVVINGIYDLKNIDFDGRKKGKR